MQVLTPTGYKDINDINIGDDVVSYDTYTGAIIYNKLEGKVRWTEDMFPPVDAVYELDADGNQVLDADGNPIIVTPAQTSQQVFQQTYGDWKFYLINGTYKLFCNQSIWDNIDRVVHVSELQVGDVIYDDKNADMPITSIEEVSGDEWWKLKVSGDHSYISDNIILHNASRYWSGNMTASSLNWNYTTGGTNWGSASGVADNASVPTSTDDVTFDGAGTNGNTTSTISATITILSLNITSGYTSTMTHNAVLTIAGNWTFGTSYTIAGSSGVTISANSTITSGGKTWPNALGFSVTTNTATLSGNFTVSGLVTISAATTINKTTSETLTCSGGLAVNSNFNLSGASLADIYLTGGTWSGTNTIGGNVYINGNITLSGTYVRVQNGTLTYISGTVTNVSTDLVIYIPTACTLNTSGITWKNVTIGGTITLTSNFSCSGLVTMSSTTIINKTTSETFTIGGGITVNSTLSGTADVYLTGGTWSGSNIIQKNLYLNGNITITGVVYFYYYTLTYLGGTITTTGSTLTGYQINLNTNGVIWNNASISSTCVLLSDFSVSGLFSTGGITINKTTSEKITIGGGITIGNSSFAGNVDVYWTGGTWTSTGGLLSNNLYINGNVTLSGNVPYGLGATSIITYLSGTVTTTGSTLQIWGTTGFNTSGMKWNNITFINFNPTITLTSNLTANGLVTISSTTTLNKTTSETLTCGGGITVNAALSGTADVYLTGGTWSGFASSIANNVFLNGNVNILNIIFGGTTGNTLKYLSGNITHSGRIVISSGGSINLDTSIVAWDNFEFATASQTVTLLSDLNINGVLISRGAGNGATVNTSNNSSIIVNGNTSNNPAGYNLVNGSPVGGLIMTSPLLGTATLKLNGGVWTGTATLTLNTIINGNITIIASITYQTNNLSWISGTVKTLSATLNVTGTSTLTNIHKIAFKAVTVTAGSTLTMNQFFSGTPGQITQVTSSGANYTVTFTDNFEKIAKNVAISGCTLTRPMQLLVVSNPKFNTNRSTNNLGIRYINQSPNGIAQNQPSIGSVPMVPVSQLVSDPCFQMQG